MDENDYLFEPVRIVVLDTATGETAEAQASLWDVCEGNWSCDCNRGDLFEPDDDREICAGSFRYLVVSIESPPGSCETLFEANASYPPALIERFIGVPSV